MNENDKNKYKDITEVNKEIQEQILSLPEEQQLQMQSAAKDLDDFATDYKQMIKGIRMVVLILFAGMLLFAGLFFSFGMYSSRLEDTIARKNVIIFNYQHRDSLYEKLLDVKDSMYNITYRMYNGEVVTYHQLEQQYDSILRLYYKEQNENLDNQAYLKMIKEMYPAITTSRSEGQLHVSGPDYHAQITTAYACVDSLERECRTAHNDYEKAKLKYELISKHYPIIVKQDSNRFYIEAPKIDSALLLLPYYRDKLLYHPDTRTWTITHPKK